MYTWKKEAKKFECMIDSNNFSCVCGAILFQELTRGEMGQPK
jgi:hypothetical protein